VTPSVRRRLDVELVRRGLAGSRHQAQELIAAGRVTVGGGPALKASRLVGPGEPVLVTGTGARFVSRGGEKLAAALERFDVPVERKRALDAGASTGGFTDCLLQQGVRCVVAVDVGYGQLHERLRDDPRVEVRDRTNIRDVKPGDLGEPFDLVVADLSFISLELVLPHLLCQTRPGGHLVLLAKPQFEAGRAEASRGRGVIRDPEVWRRVLSELRDTVHHAGAAIMGGMVSPLLGSHGNVEFLLHVAAPRSGTPSPTDPSAAGTGPGIDVDDLVDQAVRLQRSAER
jgi:23S rRNA (cytidine1920-2'-O)/16S rRNA (cytidine1409-2'-O)-methyltransferase